MRESGFRSQTLFSVDSSPLAEEKKTPQKYNKKKVNVSLGIMV